MRNQVNFDTSNKSFSEIIGNNKKYNVPKYQRDYSWEEEQWEDLWQDILEIHQQKEENREEHYMGYLVLQKQTVNQFKIIDGQQRLTTLSLIILAALQILNRSSDSTDKERAALIRSNYISTKSVSSLTHNYKLELNRNNNEYYRNDLANLAEHPRKRGIKKTEHLMRKAKEFYENAISKLNLNGEHLGQFIENIISNHLLFTVITVGDDLNAYKVFETLNARGVQLSTPDLLKNHLFSIIDPNYENKSLIEEQEEKWSITLDSLGREDFSRFLRTFWNSRNSPPATKTNLFKKIKKEYTRSEESIKILEELKESSSIYAALRNKEDEEWKYITNDKNKRKIQNCLFNLRLFNIVQPYTILLSAHLQYNEKDFANICHWLHAFCFRYHTICNLPAYDIERFYNSMAKSIYEKTDMSEIKKGFKNKMPNDEFFRENFITRTFPISSQTNRKARYILASMENHINSSNPLSLEGSNYTIEHILPKKGNSSEDYWRSQFGDLLEQSVKRLGNLTLLSKNDNKEVDRGDFHSKKAIYKRSSLKIVQKLCEYQDWNMQSLNEYQKFLADTAAQVWKID